MARTNLASGFAGFLIGVVTGCAICAAAAVFITNSPIPFVEKVQKVTADVDPAQKLAGGIDPNRALNEQQEKSAEQDDSSGVTTVTVAPPSLVLYGKDFAAAASLASSVLVIIKIPSTFFSFRRQKRRPVDKGKTQDGALSPQNLTIVYSTIKNW